MIKTARLVMFENFTAGNVQENYDRLLDSLGLEPSMTVDSKAVSLK